MTRDAYRFRQVTARDLAMLARWLEQPEPRRWWGDPETQLALLRDDLDEPGMTMRIVEFEGRAFAYAQHYEVHRWPQAHLSDLPVGTRAIDAFIGDPDMLGRGHGSRFLRLLAQSLRAGGAPVVAIDPLIENRRARRAYARAGFRAEAEVETAEGRVMLMIFDDRVDPRGPPDVGAIGGDRPADQAVMRSSASEGSRST